MDPAELGASVAHIMAQQLQELGGSIIDHARVDAGAVLYRMAAARLRSSPQGAEALTAVEANPADPRGVSQLAQVLDEEARRDPDFGGQLWHLAQQVGQGGQGATGPGGMAVGNINISTSGNLANKNSILAGAGAIVSQVRATRINTGGIVAIIVVAILTIGTGVTVAADQLVETPSEVTDSYFEALFDGDVTRLRSVTCAEGQENLDGDEIRALRQLPIEYEAEWEVLGEEVAGSHATVRVEVTGRDKTDPDAKEERNTSNIELVDEDGWKVCGWQFD